MFLGQEEEQIVITCQNVAAAGNESNVDVSIHTYPYHTIPLLKSHLHPKFVIFNGGCKLTGLEAHGAGALYTRIINEFPSLEKVMSVYDSWRAKVPEVVLKDETYVDPKSVLQPYDHDGDYNNQTKSGHGDGYRLTALSQDDEDSDGEGDSDDHNDCSGPPRTQSFTAAEQDGKGVMSGRGGPGKRGNQKAGKQGNQKTGKQKVPSESL